MFEYSNTQILLYYCPTVLYCTVFYYIEISIRMFEFECSNITVLLHMSVLHCCTVLCPTVLYCCHTVLYCTLFECYCTTLLVHVRFTSTVLYCILYYCTVLHCVIQYCTVLYRIVLYYCTDLLNIHVVSI